MILPGSSEERHEPFWSLKEADSFEFLGIKAVPIPTIRNNTAEVHNAERCFNAEVCNCWMLENLGPFCSCCSYKQMELYIYIYIIYIYIIYIYIYYIYNIYNIYIYIWHTHTYTYYIISYYYIYCILYIHTHHHTRVFWTILYHWFRCGSLFSWTSRVLDCRIPKMGLCLMLRWATGAFFSALSGLWAGLPRKSLQNPSCASLVEFQNQSKAPVLRDHERLGWTQDPSQDHVTFDCLDVVWNSWVKFGRLALEDATGWQGSFFDAESASPEWVPFFSNIGLFKSQRTAVRCEARFQHWEEECLQLSREQTMVNQGPKGIQIAANSGLAICLWGQST